MNQYYFLNKLASEEVGEARDSQKLIRMDSY